MHNLWPSGPFSKQQKHIHVFISRSILKIRICSVAQLCLTLCDPMDCTPSGSSVQGTLQTRVLQGVAISSSRGSSPPRDWNCISSCISGSHLHWQVWKDVCVLSHVWLFSTLWTVAHQSLLSMGSLQARTLDWIAIPSSRGSSQPRDQTHVSCSPALAGGFFTLHHLGSSKSP